MRELIDLLFFVYFCAAAFAYHFMPVSVHHVHHYQSNAQYPVYYDYRNSSNLNTSTPNEPIIYNYSPPANGNVTLSRTSSEENDNETEAINPNNYFIAGLCLAIFKMAHKRFIYYQFFSLYSFRCKKRSRKYAFLWCNERQSTSSGIHCPAK